MLKDKLLLMPTGWRKLKALFYGLPRSWRAQCCFFEGRKIKKTKVKALFSSHKSEIWRTMGQTGCSRTSAKCVLRSKKACLSAGTLCKSATSWAALFFIKL